MFACDARLPEQYSRMCSRMGITPAKCNIYHTNSTGSTSLRGHWLLLPHTRTRCPRWPLIHRPLLFYCFTELLALLTHALLLAAGCSLRTDPTTGMRLVTAGLGSSRSGSSGTVAGAKAAAAGAGMRAGAGAVASEVDRQEGSKDKGVEDAVGGGSSSRPVVVAVSSCCGGGGVGEEADGDGEVQGDRQGGAPGSGKASAKAQESKDEGEVEDAGEPPLAPVVFLHGVGVGLLPYVNFIRWGPYRTGHRTVS